MNTKKNFRISMTKEGLPSLAAIRDGNGGQQNKQHRSRTESVFIVQSSEKKKNILSNLPFLYCLIRLSRIQNIHTYYLSLPLTMHTIVWLYSIRQRQMRKIAFGLKRKKICGLFLILIDVKDYLYFIE